MKNNRFTIFKSCEDKLQCPLCSKKMFLNKHGSFICKKRHCFDLSANGYVNFVPNQSQKKNNYSKELFLHRKKILRAGFYEALLNKIGDIIQKKLCKNQNLSILDAGCGEGYYSEKLASIYGTQLYAMDISKEAIALAAKNDCDVACMVADLSAIPIKNNSIDIILNILTPANYDEFVRILSANGLIIKVIPGQHYLNEIRQRLNKLSQKPFSNERVISYFKEHLNLIQTYTVCYKQKVSEADLESFLKMTPMTFGVDTSSVDISGIEEITIHLEVLIGTPFV